MQVLFIISGGYMFLRGSTALQKFCVMFIRLLLKWKPLLLTNQLLWWSLPGHIPSLILGAYYRCGFNPNQGIRCHSGSSNPTYTKMAAPLSSWEICRCSTKCVENFNSFSRLSLYQNHLDTRDSVARFVYFHAISKLFFFFFCQMLYLFLYIMICDFPSQITDLFFA